MRVGAVAAVAKALQAQTAIKKNVIAASSRAQKNIFVMERRTMI
jgi:hypothetical protein